MSFTDAGNDAQPPQPQPQGGGGPPQSGSPVLAALQRAQAGPQPSTPGPGNMADAFLKISQGTQMIEAALPGLPDGSRQKQDILAALQRIQRHIPQSQPTGGAELTLNSDIRNTIMRSPLMQAISRGLQGQGQQQQPMMPSTPLPGA